VSEIYTQMEAFPDKSEDNNASKEEVTSIADATPEAPATEPLPRINIIRAKYVLQAEEELNKERGREPFSHMDVAVKAAQKWVADNDTLSHPPDKIKTEDEMLETYEKYLAAKEKYPAEVLDLILHGKAKPEAELAPKKVRVKRSPREGWMARLEREQDEREDRRRKLMGVTDLTPEIE